MREIVNKTFFDDVLTMYADTEIAYVVTGTRVDELGYKKNTFARVEVFGSLQTSGSRVSRSKKINTVSESFTFYCKYDTVLKIDDFLVRDKQLLIVKSSTEIKEFNVRILSLEKTSISAHRNLSEFIQNMGAKNDL